MTENQTHSYFYNPRYYTQCSDCEKEATYQIRWGDLRGNRDICSTHQAEWYHNPEHIGSTVYRRPNHQCYSPLDGDLDTTSFSRPIFWKLP